MVSKEIRKLIAEAKALSDEDLLKRLQYGAETVAEGIKIAATSYMEALERGLDVLDSQYPFKEFFPDIVSGKMNVEVISRYGNKPKLVRAIGSLVPEEQEKLLKPEAKLPILKQNGNQYDIAITPIGSIEEKDVSWIFAERRILSPKEQRKYAPPIKETKRTEVPKVEYPPSERYLCLDQIYTKEQLAFMETWGEKNGMSLAEVDRHTSAKYLKGFPETPVNANVRVSAKNRGQELRKE
jgi:hypothetical protein